MLARARVRVDTDAYVRAVPVSSNANPLYQHRHVQAHPLQRGSFRRTQSGDADLFAVGVEVEGAHVRGVRERLRGRLALENVPHANLCCFGKHGQKRRTLEA